MFDASTLVRDEIGEDYTLKVICDVNDDNMVIVRIYRQHSVECTPSSLSRTAS